MSIDEYCRQHIDGYDERVSSALWAIDRMRCPLQIADSSLYEEMERCIEDWADGRVVDMTAEDVLFNS